MAMTDPDGYERAITLVGMVANELRQQCGDLESVLERRNELIATTRTGGRERARARWTAARCSCRRSLRPRYRELQAALDR